MFDRGENITVIIGDQFMPDTFPVMNGGTCASIIRFHGLTMENLNFYVLGPLSDHGRNWDGLGNYGIGELLVKYQEMGKTIFTTGFLISQVYVTLA